MESNKLENEIREKLGKRAIHPSAQAWDRLDAMLTVQESKEQKKAFPWMQIAAGLVLFLGIGYFVFISGTNATDKVNTNTVVQTSIDSLKEKESNAAIATTDSFIEKEKQQEGFVSKEIKKESVLHETKSKKQVSENILPIVKTETQIVQNEKNDENKELATKNEPKNIETGNQIIAEVKTSVGKQKLKIDPNALLNQVEGEVTFTFRQKVMKTVAKGYKEAKEAVASRNQESSINH